MDKVSIFYRPDGTEWVISKETPVDVLLEVIGSLSSDLERERNGHAMTRSMMRLL